MIPSSFPVSMHDAESVCQFLLRVDGGDDSADACLAVGKLRLA